MEIRFLAAESFGVRSLATLVRVGGETVLIDPGESLAPRRYGLPPHTLELEASRRARERILAAAREADTVVLTHYHHDHFTPEEERPLEFTTPEKARALYAGKRILAKDWRGHINFMQRRRAERFVAGMGRGAVPADGRTFGALRFSPAVPHGEAGSRQGWVVMVAVRGGDGRLFVHASDIQLLHPPTVRLLLALDPGTVLVSGPPVYLPQVRPARRAAAGAALRELARRVPCLVVDHHYLRDPDALGRVATLDRFARRFGHRVLTAAAFMGEEPRLLEAGRDHLHGRG